MDFYWSTASLHCAMHLSCDVIDGPIGGSMPTNMQLGRSQSESRAISVIIMSKVHGFKLVNQYHGGGDSGDVDPEFRPDLPLLVQPYTVF